MINSKKLIMDLGLYCDSCHESFDTHDKIPMILGCGHTVCRDCALLTQSKKINIAISYDLYICLGDSYCKLCDKT